MSREVKPGVKAQSKSKASLNGIGLVHRRSFQLDPEAKEITIWEEGNPLCLVNLLPKVVAEYVKKLTPEICALSEHEHRLMYQNSEVDELLRIAFWDEFFQTCDDMATGADRVKMRMDAIYPRICSKETFYNAAIHKPERLAFIIKPPKGYMLTNRNLLEMGYNKFREILKLPLIDAETGKANTPLIGQVIKMVVLLENRVRGSVAHQLNIQSQSVVANVNYEAPLHNRNIDYELEKADKEIAALSDKYIISDRSLAAPAEITVNSKDLSEEILVE